jgi:nucleotide-binding universal stress UspA family protein
MSAVDTEASVVLGVPPETRLTEGTISFVVDTAARLGLGIELVLVVPTMVGGPTGTWEVGVTFDQLVDEGRVRLDEALSRVRDRAGPNQVVTAELVRGGVSGTLIERSRRAQLVVLQHRRLGRLQRLSLGSVTAAVAARAHAPVISVPEEWRPVDQSRPITVGVEDAKRAEAELWTALGLAAASDRPLQIVRATYLAEAYQEILRREVREDDFLAAARAELVRDAQLPDDVCERVPCTFEVRWGKAAEVLVDASAGSSLLVVARRDPLLPFGSHLGPVVRQLLQEAWCPVMVVEPTLTEPVQLAERQEPVAATG